jgi:predicted amidohydrolase
MKTLNVALVQYACNTPDKKLNTDIGLRFVREAKSLGADIVLFPECWIIN